MFLWKAEKGNKLSNVCSAPRTAPLRVFPVAVVCLVPVCVIVKGGENHPEALSCRLLGR